MYLDLLTIQWVLLGSACLCAFMIAKAVYNQKTDDVIEKTILFLVDNKMIKWKHNEDGEIEIIPLDEK